MPVCGLSESSSQLLVPGRTSERRCDQNEVVERGAWTEDDREEKNVTNAVLTTMTLNESKGFEKLEHAEAHYERV